MHNNFERIKKSIELRYLLDVIFSLIFSVNKIFDMYVYSYDIFLIISMYEILG